MTMRVCLQRRQRSVRILAITSSQRKTDNRPFRFSKEATRVDLLFSDIVMPGGINGVQLAREARRLKPKLKVLLTSGYTAAVLTNEHRLPKEFPVLGKPYRREQLASNLREIIKSPAPRVNAD